MAPFQLPPMRYILITTPNTILLQSEFDRHTLFQCATPDGILNAKAARNNSGLLVVADSHLVILYDVKRGRDRKYRLKSGDGEPRMLLFSPCSRTLYFTTTLSCSIQAYSIPNAELLPPLHAHPSPPNILAISRLGDILLSASPTPPTIYLQDLRKRGNAPISFHPNRSQSSVACAAFHDNDHPSRQTCCLFLLGFQDGTLALYRLVTPKRLHLSNVADPIASAPTYQLHQPSKLGFFKRLHKAAMGGISAVEFLPKYESRVVSVGHDGRCRLVDFEDGGSILRTWYVSGPATCLSVIPLEPIRTKGRKDIAVVFSGDAATDEEPVYEGTETLITVGTEAGKVMVFNILGLLIHEISVEASVVGVEWVGDMSATSALPSRQSSVSVRVKNDAAMLPQPHRIVDDPIEINENIADDAVEEEEASGTVRINRKPQSPTSVPSPIPRVQVRDFFSHEPESRSRQTSAAGPSIWAPRKVSEVSYGSPEPVDRTAKRSRRTYPRPRIVTETFKTPNPIGYTHESPLSMSNSSRPSSGVPTPGSPLTPSPAPSPKYSSQHTPLSQQPEQAQLMSGALQLRLQSPDSFDTENRLDGADEPDIWMTPPTSHHTHNSGGMLSPQHSVAGEAPRVRFQFSSPPKWDASPSRSAMDLSRFPERSSPKGFD